MRDVTAPQWRRHSHRAQRLTTTHRSLLLTWPLPADVVFRAGSITSIEIDEDWSTVFVDDVEMIGDSRPDRTPITRFGAFGAGIEDRPSIAVSALEGMEVVVFAHMSDRAPGNLVATASDLAGYTTRRPTRWEHISAVERHVGFRRAGAAELEGA